MLPIIHSTPAVCGALRDADTRQDAPIPIEWVRREWLRAEISAMQPTDIGALRNVGLTRQHEFTIRSMLARLAFTAGKRGLRAELLNAAGDFSRHFESPNCLLPFFAAQVPRTVNDLDTYETALRDAVPALPTQQITLWFGTRRKLLVPTEATEDSANRRRPATPRDP